MEQQQEKLLLIFFLVVPPTFLSFFLFPFWVTIWERTYSLQEEIGAMTITSEDIYIRPTIRTLLADALQVPLNLKWYNIYIQDISDIPEEANPKQFIFIFDEGNPEKYFRSSFKKLPEEGQYEIPIGGEVRFVYPSNDTFSFRRMVTHEVGPDIPTLLWDPEHPFPVYKISLKSYIPILIVKYFLIFSFWFVLYSSFITIAQSFQKAKNSNNQNNKKLEHNNFMKQILQKIKKTPLLIKLLTAIIGIIATHLVLYFYCPGLGYMEWTLIESIILAITAVAISFQAYYTKKHVEISSKNITLSVMPGVFFALRSLRTTFKRGGKLDAWEILLRKEKLRTQFIVQNNSRFPVLFKVKITFRLDDKKILHDHYWENALHVNPGTTTYPDVIHLEGIIADKGIGEEELKNMIRDKEDKEIFVDIEYKYTPRFVEVYSESISEHWRFSLKEFIWIGPNGMKDENIYLPGEG